MFFSSNQTCLTVKVRFIDFDSDNSYRHFTPEVRGKVLLLKLI